MNSQGQPGRCVVGDTGNGFAEKCSGLGSVITWFQLNKCRQIVLETQTYPFIQTMIWSSGFYILQRVSIVTRYDNHRSALCNPEKFPAGNPYKTHWTGHYSGRELVSRRLRCSSRKWHLLSSIFNNLKKSLSFSTLSIIFALHSF